ncbi:MAG: hypothetical protein Kow0098_24220 [Ignavibacteriaceae bacterium]
MAGKASLIVVIAFTALFMVIGQNFGTVSNRAVDNIIQYHNEAVAHNIALSGANIASNYIYLDNSWNEGINDMPFHGGYLDVSVEIIDPYQDLLEVTCTGTYEGVTNTIKVQFAPTKYSKFAYYSVYEGGSIWWTGTDTVWGPFHTQDYMRVYRHPVFYGKATTKKKLIYYTNKSKDKPYFYGGFEQGVNLPLPVDGLNKIRLAAQDEGLYIGSKDTMYATFDNDTLRYRFAYYDPDTAVYLPNAATNGVIFVDNAVVRLKGVVKGQYTIACDGTSGDGKIFLDDDIVYSSDPRIDPSSTDLLGIVAKNEVIITDNANNHSDINIHGAIYAEEGGFGAENYGTRPPSGNINLLGGIVQNIRRAVGTFNYSGISSGFSKRYKYDERLLVASPPYYPGTGGYEIVSWLE